MRVLRVMLGKECLGRLSEECAKGKNVPKNCRLCQQWFQLYQCLVSTEASLSRQVTSTLQEEQVEKLRAGRGSVNLGCSGDFGSNNNHMGGWELAS